MVKRTPSPKVLAAIVVGHLVLTTLAWRDIGHRTDDQIRGSKKVWRVATGANSVNSLAYFIFGRKRKAS
jgi:hypothetical protein